MKKDCESCRHRMKPGNEFPCEICSHNHSDMWQANSEEDARKLLTEEMFTMIGRMEELLHRYEEEVEE